MTYALHICDDASGLWQQRLTKAGKKISSPKRAALFLDRDGVLLEEVNYLHKLEDMQIIPGAAAAVRRANLQGIPVVVVTNQSGIGRGYYSWTEFAAVQAAMIQQFEQEGAYFDMVLACAYHADAQSPFDTADHPWRKPRPGMLNAAESALSLDLSQSWIVGDSTSDMEAGRNAGLAGGVHVATGHGMRDRAAAQAVATAGFDVQAEESIADTRQILQSMPRTPVLD